GADIGHDAQGKDGQLLEPPACEHVEKAEERSPRALEDARQNRAVDAGRRDVDAYAVYCEEGKGDEDAPLKLGNLPDVLETTHYCATSTSPPRAFILSIAFCDALCTFTLRGKSISPSDRSFTPSLIFPMSPLSMKSCRPASLLPLKTWRSPIFTRAYSFLKGFLKPLFGILRVRGIWPPSKPFPFGAPARALCPLFPIVAVLPWPEPGPLPIRFFAFREPSCGFRSSSLIY